MLNEFACFLLTRFFFFFASLALTIESKGAFLASEVSSQKNKIKTKGKKERRKKEANVSLILG